MIHGTINIKCTLYCSGVSDSCGKLAKLFVTLKKRPTQYLTRTKMITMMIMITIMIMMVVVSKRIEIWGVLEVVIFIFPFFFLISSSHALTIRPDAVFLSSFIFYFYASLLFFSVAFFPLCRLCST